MKAYILKIMLANLIYLWKTVKHKNFYTILLFFFSYTNSRRKGNLNKYFKTIPRNDFCYLKRVKAFYIFTPEFSFDLLEIHKCYQNTVF